MSKLMNEYRFRRDIIDAVYDYKRYDKLAAISDDARLLKEAAKSTVLKTIRPYAKSLGKGVAFAVPMAAAGNLLVNKLDEKAKKIRNQMLVGGALSAAAIAGTKMLPSRSSKDNNKKLASLIYLDGLLELSEDAELREKVASMLFDAVVQEIG